MKNYGKVAILYPGDYEVRRKATTDNNRLASIFDSLAKLGIHAEQAVYNDDFCKEVWQHTSRDYFENGNQGRLISNPKYGMGMRYAIVFQYRSASV